MFCLEYTDKIIVLEYAVTPPPAGGNYNVCVYTVCYVIHEPFLNVFLIDLNFGFILWTLSVLLPDLKKLVAAYWTMKEGEGVHEREKKTYTHILSFSQYVSLWFLQQACVRLCVCGGVLCDFRSVLVAHMLIPMWVNEFSN